METLRQKKIWITASIIAATAIVFFVFLPRRERIVTPPTPVITPFAASAPSTTSESTPTSSPSIAMVNPLTGEACNNAQRRPVAVMLAGDSVARPLSGIAQADMVFEMPVITGSITRFMAVYVCRDPIEIGSVRSARDDFIPLALGLDAIYAHWGGSHFAMDLLKKHAIDNIDAIVNPIGAYWRKENIAAPHNGFTSMTRLMKAAKFLQYRLSGNAPAYSHIESVTSIPGIRGNLEIGYPGEFRLRYEYDPITQSYVRIRGGITERDKNSGEAVTMRNIVVLRALSRQIEGQYNDVTIEGSGNAIVYRGGEELPGTWQKDKKDPAAKLIFLDAVGSKISFLPGNIWVEIVEPYTDVNWKVTE